MMTIPEATSEVMQRGPARHDMCGQFKGYPLSDTGGRISKALTNRLAKYALSRLKEWDLVPANIKSILVGTSEAEDKVADRYYYVHVTNSAGAVFQVTGVMLKSNQQVLLDHGIHLEFE